MTRIGSGVGGKYKSSSRNKLFTVNYFSRTRTFYHLFLFVERVDFLCAVVELVMKSNWWFLFEVKCVFCITDVAHIVDKFAHKHILLLCCEKTTNTISMYYILIISTKL